MYAQHMSAGTLVDDSDCADADRHGQFKFNHKHPHIKDGQETEFLLKAFNRDFEINGPSIVRVVRTTLRGWQRYKHHPDLRIRRRFAWEARDLSVSLAGVLWATRRWFRSNPILKSKITGVLRELYREFGFKSRVSAPFVGRYIQFLLHREDRRLRRGWTYEPPTFYEEATNRA
ncbi:MAG: hypothetical protein IH877_00655 [Gemmatimonadetes bacterium]|nr:hypothetical protein [Gemmatimonadota bacterium]